MPFLAASFNQIFANPWKKMIWKKIFLPMETTDSIVHFWPRFLKIIANEKECKYLLILNHLNFNLFEQMFYNFLSPVYYCTSEWYDAKKQSSKKEPIGKRTQFNMYCVEPNLIFIALNPIKYLISDKFLPPS